MTFRDGGARRKQGTAVAVIVATALGLGACAKSAVELSDTFSPPRGWPDHSGGVVRPMPCPVWFDDIVDGRANQHDVGTIAYRMVHSNDTVAYLRSGIGALARDPRLAISDHKDDRALAVRLELLKAYMFSQVTAKMTNIVVRARFTPSGGAAWEATYRGDDHAVNWASTGDETQAAFDRSLADVLGQLDADILTHCG